MTTRTASKNRAIIFLTGQLFFTFALAVVFLHSAWAGEDLSTLRAKAEAGDAKAQKSLGLLYSNGQGVPQDYGRARHWFHLAAHQGYPPAQNDLGLLYANGQGVPQDYGKARHWFRLAAHQGYPLAQNDLGFLYAYGQGVPQDYGKARHWFHLAAQQGSAPGQSNLGFLYAYGQGVPQDYGKANQWWRLAAKQGYAPAQANLGFLYANGQGVPQDYEQAAYWFRLAAKQGYAMAQYNLGLLYYNGQGMLQDYGKAAQWWRLAAKQGYAMAQYNLGVAYATGQEVPQDRAKAAWWYRLAAKQGYAKAEYNIGLLYAKGQGVPQNYVRAYKWWILAKAAGIKIASKDLDLLMPRMTQDQVAEGQRLAEQWTATKNGSAPPAEARTNPFPGNPGSGPSSPDLLEIRKMLETQNQEIANMRSKKEASAKSTPHYSSMVDRPDFHLPKHQSWYAVVVGVEQYPKGIPPAEFSERDAQAVKANLIALGYPESHIRLLTNDQATDARVNAILKNWLPRNVPKGGRVLFYFAGHGGTDPTSKTAYLVPFDGDPEDLPDTALSVGEVENEIGKLPLSRGIIVADACFSGAGGRSVLPKGARPLITVHRTPDKTPYRNLTVFGASMGNQISGNLPKQGHGIFTYYLLLGLEGKAKTANAVTPKSLKRYLSRTVPLAFRHHYNSGEQNPVISGDMNGVLVKY